MNIPVGLYPLFSTKHADILNEIESIKKDDRIQLQLQNIRMNA